MDSHEKKVTDWAAEAKTALVQVGMNFKGLIQEAQKLVAATAKAHDATKSISKETNIALSFLNHAEALCVAETPDMGELKAVFGEIKKHIEASSTTVAGALAEFDEVFTSTKDFSEVITNTRKSLMHEAEIVQSLKSQVDAQNAGDTASDLTESA